MHYTIDHAIRGIERLPGIRLRAVIRTGTGIGLLLSERPDAPGVLGLGAIDATGDAAALGLNAEEARQLRDALNDWLKEPAPVEESYADPWLDPDAAARAVPPPF